MQFKILTPVVAVAASLLCAGQAMAFTEDAVSSSRVELQDVNSPATLVSRFGASDQMSSTIGRWMDTSLASNFQSFSLAESVGNGDGTLVQFRHSQADQIDPDYFNANHRLHSTSELLFTQRVGGSWVHAMAAKTDREARYDLGFRAGPLSITAGRGHGRSVVKLGGNMNDVNPWFFAGGRNLPFSFSGATATLDFSSRTTAEVGAWRLDMQSLEPRHTRFIGLRSGRFTGRFYDVSRKDVAHVSQAMDLGMSMNRFDLAFREIRHIDGARSQRLSFGMAGKKSLQYGLSFGRDTNPGYRDAQDTRVMLSLAGRFGGRGLLHATDTATQTDEEAEGKSKRVRNIALIGGGAVALAAVAGGGGSDDNSGNNPRFNREQGAAFDVLNTFNPRCVRENREYGGWVYRYGDGSYSYIDPKRGDIDSVQIGSPEDVPTGAVSTATYHCHGGPDPRYDNENFSPQDIFADSFYSANGYLSTPGGQFKKHDARTGAITTIGRIAR